MGIGPEVAQAKSGVAAHAESANSAVNPVRFVPAILHALAGLEDELNHPEVAAGKGHMLGAMLHAEVDGRSLTFDEMLSMSMMLFLGVLTVGFIYEWKKGALEWE